MILALTVVHVLMCSHLAYTVYDRGRLMSADVYVSIRAVFWGLGCAALWGVAAPIVIGFVPDAYSLAMTGAICAVQHVTNRYWHNRVPDPFYRPGALPRCRRATDPEMPS